MHTSPLATTDPAPFSRSTVTTFTHLSTGRRERDEFCRIPGIDALLVVAVASDNGAAIILFDPIPPQSDPVECAVVEGVYSEVVQ